MDEPAPPPAPAAQPRVDVVVAVHNSSRPVERVVASALRARTPVRVTVVAHNHDPAAILARLVAHTEDPRLRVVPLRDGIPSPAGPFNRGIDLATAEFVCIAGSDDEFEEGAIDDWVDRADRHRADVVVAPIRRTSGGWGTMPRVRPGRVARLDADRDRLFERVAPLGLIRRSVLADLRFAEGLPRGEDLAFGLHLWLSGLSVVFDPAARAYLEHDDQDDRVTQSPRPFADDLLAWDVLEGDAAFAAATPAARRGVAAKLARGALVDGILHRAGSGALAAADRAALGAALLRLERWGPGFRGLLARRDLRVLDSAMLSGPTGDLRVESSGRGRFLSFDALVPASPFLLLHRHAPVRSLIAARLLRRRLDAGRRAAQRAA